MDTIFMMIPPMEEWQKVYSGDIQKNIAATTADGQILEVKWEQEDDLWIGMVFYNGPTVTPVTFEISE